MNNSVETYEVAISVGDGEVRVCTHESIADAMIYDAQGRLVGAYRLAAGNNTIDTRAFPKGIYVLRTAGYTYKIALR